MERKGELGNWRVGELGSWGIGELGSWGVGGDKEKVPLETNLPGVSFYTDNEVVWFPSTKYCVAKPLRVEYILA